MNFSGEPDSEVKRDSVKNLSRASVTVDLIHCLQNCS